MLFGDRSDFAIEADVEPDLKPPSAVWGRMCVWCGGVSIGDITDPYCALYPAYRAFGSLASSVNSLWSDELVGLDDLAMLNFFDGLLYGYHGEVELKDDRTVEQCQRDWVVWGCFNFLTNWGEQFDRCKAFIVCPPSGPVRILSRDLPDHVGLSVEVSLNGVIEAVKGFTRWFEKQERQLQVE
jgi:hypothetical protein